MGNARTDLGLALAIADEADRISMSRYRATDLVVETKPDLTPVTEADKAVEQQIRLLLESERPSDGVLGEEFPDTNAEQSRHWIIDPIDGTKNYVRGVPVWATLIALVVDGEPQVGVVSAPALGRRWWAARGEGAFTREVNGEVRSLRVSGVSSLSDASFSFSDSVGWDAHGNSNGLANITSSVWRSRAYGDFWSHLLVAEGAVDIAAEPELNAWDMAAFIPIVREAGGTVTGYKGADPFEAGNAVTTNGLLHTAVLGLIND